MSLNPALQLPHTSAESPLCQCAARARDHSTRARGVPPPGLSCSQPPAEKFRKCPIQKQVEAKFTVSRSSVSPARGRRSEVNEKLPNDTTFASRRLNAASAVRPEASASFYKNNIYLLFIFSFNLITFAIHLKP